MLEPAQADIAQPQRVPDAVGEAPAPAVVAPGPASAAGVLALQRSAGNAAVSKLLAGGGGGPVLARKPDPPELPISGDANIMLLEQERFFPLDLPDLGEFDLGKGELSTGPIGIGDGVEIELDVGAHNPPRLADASLHMSPVEANIAASVIAERREAAKAGGVEGAIVGGILGGIGNPLHPITGAEQGGLEGGKAGEKAAEWFMDRFALQATLVSGTLSGHLRLLYSPYIRVRVGGEFFSKFIDVNATLQTQMGLSLVPSLSVAGSHVGLHFEKGKLARSEFSLELEAALEAALDVTGMLQLGVTLLNLVEGHGTEAGKQKAHDDPGLFNFSILDTDVFPILEDFRGRMSAKTKLDLVKASPLDLAKKHFTAKDGSVSDILTSGMKQRLGPATKQARSGKGKGGGGAGDGPDGKGGKRYHTGTYQDPVPMSWYKPPGIYPDTLDHDGGDDVRKFPHRTYEDGLEAGVDAEYWPWVGKKFKKGAGVRAGGGTTVGQADLAAEFTEHGVHWGGGEGQIDHVMDDALGGPDQPENLWPLESKANADAGLKHGHQSVRYKPDPAGPDPANPMAVHNVKAGTWFVITEELQPGDALKPDGAPEKS